MMKSALDKNQKELRKRIIEISFNNKLSHIGSCLNSVDIIDAIYSHKKPQDLFVLSSGHAGVALYAVLEKYNPLVRFDVIDCIHPDRLSNSLVHVSTGSLGQGLPIALGMALADKSVDVYCLISDGECAEGSIWESLRVVSEVSISNLVVLVSANGFGAYGPISSLELKKRLKGFGLGISTVNGNDPVEIKSALKNRSTDKPHIIFANTSSEQLSFLRGVDAHYYVMGQDYYEAADIFS